MRIKAMAVPLVVLALIIGGLFYFRFEVYNSHGKTRENIVFAIIKGQGNSEIAASLAEKGLISNKWYFYYYVRSHGLIDKMMPGEYQLSGDMTIGEIANVITNKEEKFVRITIPEGWDSREIAQRLGDNGLDSEGFLALVKNPGNLKKRYSYLQDVKVTSLEGFLFPDTYFFKNDTSAENIVGRMLDNFDSKLNSQLREQLKNRSISVYDSVIMASIVEKEVRTPSDMKIAAGIFWKRVSDGQRLQSDATLSYILDDKTDQHKGKDLDIDSPYNSYRNSGLPPGPISNPGMNALLAAVFPQASDFNYFLTATVNGSSQVVFSKTYEEHLANKVKFGL